MSENFEEKSLIEMAKELDDIRDKFRKNLKDTCLICRKPKGLSDYCQCGGEMNKCDGLYRELKPCSCHVDIKDVRSERDALKAENEDLIWNLAGCSTFAMGYGLDKPFDETKARAAMYDVLKCAKDRDRWRECAERMAVELKKIDEAMMPDLDDDMIARTMQLGGLLAGLKIIAHEALADFEAMKGKQ